MEPKIHPIEKEHNLPNHRVYSPEFYQFAPENIPSQKERIIFQPSFFRGKLLNFRLGKPPNSRFGRSFRRVVVLHRLDDSTQVLPPTMGISDHIKGTNVQKLRLQNTMETTRLEITPSY